MELKIPITYWNCNIKHIFYFYGSGSALFTSSIRSHNQNSKGLCYWLFLQWGFNLGSHVHQASVLVIYPWVSHSHYRQHVFPMSLDFMENSSRDRPIAIWVCVSSLYPVIFSWGWSYLHHWGIQYCMYVINRKLAYITAESGASQYLQLVFQRPKRANTVHSHRRMTQMAKTDRQTDTLAQRQPGRESKFLASFTRLEEAYTCWGKPSPNLQSPG